MTSESITDIHNEMSLSSFCEQYLDEISNQKKISKKFKRAPTYIHIISDELDQQMSSYQTLQQALRYEQQVQIKLHSSIQKNNQNYKSIDTQDKNQKYSDNYLDSCEFESYNSNNSSITNKEEGKQQIRNVPIKETQSQRRALEDRCQRVRQQSQINVEQKQWTVDMTNKFEVIVYCLGIKNCEARSIQRIAQFGFPLKRYQDHKDQFKRKVFKQYNLTSATQVENWMFNKKSYNLEIIKEITNQWRDESFKGFTDQQIINYLERIQ